MKKSLALTLLVLLSACAGTDDVSLYQPSGYLPNAGELASQADWNDPDVVETRLVNHAFVPDSLTFHRNRPTKLILINESKSDHTFVSEQFFRGIAVRQLVGPATTATAPWVEKVVVPARETKELWFIPARYGAYQFECTVTGHSLLGMNGVINVIP